jgi:dihydroorotate dehydrogenase
VSDARLQVNLGGLRFANPVGLAAGFDKNAKAVAVWPALGFGFMEVGAVTAQPQQGNPRPRLFRLPKDGALVNRLGFNNEGAEAVRNRLMDLKAQGFVSKIPLGINIGRSRSVDNRDAVADYLFTFERLYLCGDYFTLNVSSPNTPGLRELQEKRYLEELLRAVQDKNGDLSRRLNVSPRPILLKIDPDMELSQVDEVAGVAETGKATAIIATNASAFLREKLSQPTREEGGLSGKPLQERSTAIIAHIYRSCGDRLPVIGSGGVFSAADAYEKIRAGACAVQVLTGLVYEGPSMVRRINRGLLRLLERDGFKRITEAVGSRFHS